MLIFFNTGDCRFFKPFRLIDGHRQVDEQYVLHTARFAISATRSCQSDSHQHIVSTDSAKGACQIASQILTFNPSGPR